MFKVLIANLLHVSKRDLFTGYVVCLKKYIIIWSIPFFRHGFTCSAKSADDGIGYFCTLMLTCSTSFIPLSSILFITESQTISIHIFFGCFLSTLITFCFFLENSLLLLQ